MSYANLLFLRPLLHGLVAPARVVLGDDLQRKLLGLAGAQRPRGHPVHHEIGVRLIAGLESREGGVAPVRSGYAVLELGRRRG